MLWEYRYINNLKKTTSVTNDSAHANRFAFLYNMNAKPSVSQTNPRCFHCFWAESRDCPQSDVVFKVGRRTDN